MPLYRTGCDLDRLADALDEIGASLTMRDWVISIWRIAGIDYALATCHAWRKIEAVK
jgi:thymidylate synthase